MIDKKRVGFIVLLTFLYLICLGLIASGITLSALYYEQFNMYNILVKAWAENSGASSPGFSDYLNNYNSLVASNSDWVKADNTLFSVGISLLVIGVVLTGLSIWFQIKKLPSKKEKKIKTITKK